MELMRLERTVRRAKSDREKCEALCRLAEMLAGRDPRRATELAGEARAIARGKGDARNEAYALAILGPIRSLCSHDGVGLDDLQESQRIAGEIDDEEVTGKALLGEAFVRMHNRELDEALGAAERALEIAREIEDRDAESDALLMLARVYTQRSDWQMARTMLRRAERGIDRSNDASRRMNLLLCRGILSARRSEVSEAITALAEALETACHLGDRFAECTALLRLGRVHGSIGDFPNALRHLMRCAEIAAQIEVIRLELEALLDISIMNKLFGNAERSRMIAEQVLILARKHGKRSAEAWALNHLGEHAYDGDDLETALRYHRDCATLCEESRIPDLLGVSQECIGNILRDQKQYDEALEYYGRAISIAGKLGDLYTLASIDYSIALLHLDRLEFSRSIEMFTHSLERAEPIQVQPLIRSIHSTLAYVYEQRGHDGDERLALEHLKKAVELREHLMSTERQRQVADMETRARVERAEREREQEQARSRQLALEAEHRVEELNALGVHLAERTELINAVAEELHRALDATGNDRESILRRLVTTVEERGRTEQEWSGFQEKLQSINHGMLVELARWCPDLKPAELKVCALLRTQLSTKEIASLLSVTERAVEKHRYSIRRKLGLSKEENLVSYLARIAGSATGPIVTAA